MPNLCHLTINVRECGWVGDDDESNDALSELEVEETPQSDAFWMFFEAIMSGMRNRKRSNLDSVKVALKDAFVEEKCAALKDFISKNQGVWKRVKAKACRPYWTYCEADTADVNLDYSGDEHWSCTTVVKSNGSWWIGKPGPVDDSQARE
ncbi:uncharacterized protein BDZ99DRAFT_145095 [Mytilinidion resinicola]|uniref:Uncharacterized protein n=1 Tax=Mytilinidion resinicola TaxID=574789 RepID=A0A6A6Y873_9PEZI|nr:uncharacterized protein BDZ99DRAFT_145095 [Mytilinidion resinicola]KAF2804890.1 hypothetical protein BDZ99DRAFT_145095 [Mytilinidion resinicola]